MSSDNSIKILDSQTGKYIQTVYDTSIYPIMFIIKLTKTKIISSTIEGFKIWDLNNGTCLNEFRKNECVSLSLVKLSKYKIAFENEFNSIELNCSIL